MTKTGSTDCYKSPAIRLEIRGCGPVQGFKNRKRVIVPKNGRRPMLITDPSVKKRMEQITEAIVCGLCSAFQTDAAATSMGVSLPLWIASKMPADDCWTEIPHIEVYAELVPLGEEGADIEITPLCF